MPQFWYIESGILRKRCRRQTVSSSSTVSWTPSKDGSYLDILITGAFTATMDLLSLPTVTGLSSPSGLDLWVVVEKSNAAAAIDWASSTVFFRFQTVGDKLLNPLGGSVTAWHGFVRPSDVSVYMTKIGEWTGGGA